jgi:hypothetical protein
MEEYWGGLASLFRWHLPITAPLKKLIQRPEAFHVHSISGIFTIQMIKDEGWDSNEGYPCIEQYFNKRVPWV